MKLNNYLLIKEIKETGSLGAVGLKFKKKSIPIY